nr:hypothetical protein [Tanacetum cinerariifolium]
MNPVATQQVATQEVAINNSSVAPKKRLKIEKCNARIEFSKPQREETYQVTLDAFKLSPCCPAFLITTKVPEEDFMYQADNKEISLARKEHMPYPRFTKVIINHFISKDKTISLRNMINLHTIHDDSLLDSKAYKTYYDFATGKATPKKARKYKKVALPSRIPSLILDEEPAERPKKSIIVPTTGVVIRDTPHESMPKKKTPAKVDRGKGNGVGSQPNVPDESEDKKTGTDEGTDSGDDESNDDDSGDVTKNDDEDDVEIDANENKEGSDSEKTDSDEDENLNVNMNDDEEEDREEEYVHTPDSFGFNDDDEEYAELYKDANVRSKVAEHEETEGSKQSFSVSSDFASKFLNLDNVSPVVDEVASLMNVKTPHEESSTQAPLILLVHVTAILETSTIQATTVPPLIQPFTSIPQATTPTPIPTTKPTTSSIHALLYFDSIFRFNQRVSALEQEISQLKQVDRSIQILVQIPSKSSDKSAQAEELVFETVNTKMSQDQGDDLGNIEDQPNVEEASKHDCKMAKAGKPPTTFDKLISTPIDFLAYVLHNLKIENLTQEHLVGLAFNLLKGACKSRVELEFHFEECYKAVTNKLDWMNPEGHGYPFDLSKPLPLIKDQGRQVVHADYFFNNDLEYLKVTHVKVVKEYEYGYLEEIIVRREDQSLQKFVEGDFPRLNLRDIEDMLLLSVLHDIASSLETDYLPKRKWSKLDRKRSRIMIKAIDQQVFERRLMRNQEKFVGGREYINEFRLLERTI